MQSCASTKNMKQEYETERVFNVSYDDAWAALVEVVLNDLGCAQKKINKKKGILETEWIYTINTDGTIRWKLSARIKKKREGVWMMVDKIIQSRDQVSKSINKYKKKSRASEKPFSWRRSETDKNAVDDLFFEIESKLNQ